MVTFYPSGNCSLYCKARESQRDLLLSVYLAGEVNYQAEAAVKENWHFLLICYYAAASLARFTVSSSDESSTQTEQEGRWAH